MPTIPGSRAAAGPNHEQGYDSSSFSAGKFPLGVDYWFYRFFFEEC